MQATACRAGGRDGLDGTESFAVLRTARRGRGQASVRRKSRQPHARWRTCVRRKTLETGRHVSQSGAPCEMPRGAHSGHITNGGAKCFHGRAPLPRWTAAGVTSEGMTPATGASHPVRRRQARYPQVVEPMSPCPESSTTAVLERLSRR